MRAERPAAGAPDGVRPHRQGPLAREARVELADRAGGGVARVHERRQPGLRPALVEAREVLQRHVDLAADLEHRRRVLDPQRDRRDRPQVVRDVLADLAVAARRPADEHAVLVEQRDREAVDLRLGHELKLRVVDPLAREVGAHPRHPGAQLLLGAGVCERQHRDLVADLRQRRDRLAAHALRGRVGRDELGVGGLDRAQLVEQRVVLVVADRRVVEDVVAPAVLVQLGAQLGRAAPDLLRDLHQSRSCTIGSSSRARSCVSRASMPAVSVRSKCSGVTAIRPSPIAAKSVPGSSWKPGSGP